MPIHFLYGDEDYLIERQINKFKKEILGTDVNPLNFKSVDNPNFSLFCELLRTNAMMFGDILIIIKCPKYFLEMKSKEKLDDKQTAQLISSLNTIPDKVHIVLLVPTPRGEGKKPDSRKKLYKEILKLTKPLEFQSFRNYEENKIIPYINKMASELELKIGVSEAKALIQTTGSSLRDLSTQLEKLKLYAHPNSIVTLDMIKQVATNQADIFQLVDLILAKNFSSALSLISDILQKDHYLPTLAFLQTTISNMLKIKLWAGKMSNRDIAFKLNQNEYRVQLTIQKLSQVKFEDLVDLKINLENAEFNLKSGTIKDPLTAYEMAFLGGFKNA